MAIKRMQVESSGTNDYKNLPEGEYEGRLVYVADLGEHNNVYNGEVKPKVQKFALGIEIMGQKVEIDGVEKPRFLWTKPFNVFSKLTEKGNELKMAKVFNPKAKIDSVFDWETVLGNPCNVSIVNTKVGENVYDNIDSINAIPAKYLSAVAEGEIKDGSVDGDASSTAIKNLFGLTKWTYDRRINGGTGVEELVVGNDAPITKKAPVEIADSDVPF